MRAQRADAEVARLEAEVKDLAADQSEAQDRLSVVDAEIADLRRRQQELRRQLPGGAEEGGAPAGRRAELERRRVELDAQLEQLRREIADIAGRSLGLAYPSALITGTLARLGSEVSLRRWAVQRQRLAPESERLSERLFGDSAPVPSPPLTGSQKMFYRTLLATEWQGLLQPPPADAPEEPIFGQLSDVQLQDAETRLRALADRGDERLGVLLGRQADAEREHRRLMLRLDNFDIDQQVAALMQELQEIAGRLGALGQERETLEGNLQELAGALRTRQRDLTNRLNEAADTRVIAEQVRVCDDVAATISEFRDRLKVERLADLEQAIRQMVRQLAHKGERQFASVVIDPESFMLQVFDAAGDEVLKPSAGEREILALSMIWALGRISRRALPLVIDTPLGRLDSKHRRNVIENFLPRAAEQVIVLATDEEIDDARRVTLKPYLAGELELRYDEQTRRTAAVEMEPMSS